MARHCVHKCQGGYGGGGCRPCEADRVSDEQGDIFIISFADAPLYTQACAANRLLHQLLASMQNSPHFKNEQRKQQQTEQKIASMQARAKSLSPAELDGHTRYNLLIKCGVPFCFTSVLGEHQCHSLLELCPVCESWSLQLSLQLIKCPCRAMDAKLAGMQASMDLTRTWIVVDMDAFFASVEELDDPSLVCTPLSSGHRILQLCPVALCMHAHFPGLLPLSYDAVHICIVQKSKPMAVGGVGMITTANYAARKYGVRSAMPGQPCLSLHHHKISGPSREVVLPPAKGSQHCDRHPTISLPHRL